MFDSGLVHSSPLERLARCTIDGRPLSGGKMSSLEAPKTIAQPQRVGAGKTKTHAIKPRPRSLRRHKKGSAISLIFVIGMQCRARQYVGYLISTRLISYKRYNKLSSAVDPCCQMTLRKISTVETSRSGCNAHSARRKLTSKANVTKATLVYRPELD